MKEVLMIEGVEYVKKNSRLPDEQGEYVRKDSIVPNELDREGNPYWPWVIGAAYMIRTVTFHDHGTVVGVTENEIVLKKAAWIPDSGRWWNFITGKAKPSEVEPFSEEALVIIGRGAIVDATQLTDSFGVQK